MKLDKKNGLFLLILFLLVIGYYLFYKPSNNNRDEHGRFSNIENIIYTKHAKCRMACRSITADEVKDIIQNGKLNRGKSGIGSKGDSTFAMEGYSKDRQHLRIIVAPEQNKLVVITCIDIDKEWKCDCK